jgi:hypothetical protein
MPLFGMQIVHAYMENNRDVILQILMQERDAQKVLTLSGYKPEK